MKKLSKQIVAQAKQLRQDTIDDFLADDEVAPTYPKIKTLQDAITFLEDLDYDYDLLGWLQPNYPDPTIKDYLIEHISVDGTEENLMEENFSLWKDPQIAFLDWKLTSNCGQAVKTIVDAYVLLEEADSEPDVNIFIDGILTICNG